MEVQNGKRHGEEEVEHRHQPSGGFYFILFLKFLRPRHRGLDIVPPPSMGGQRLRKEINTEDFQLLCGDGHFQGTGPGRCSEVNEDVWLSAQRSPAL